MRSGCGWTGASQTVDYLAMTTDKKPQRSRKCYGRKDKDGFIHRRWMKSEGLPADVFDGRPVIGICNTWSELTPCNAGLRDL
jgi:dihydroxy-acid dehydratase